MLGNHYLGGLLLSGHLVIGIIFAFLIGFVPNYLQTVGISLATTSFYYLIVAFVTCFAAVIIRNSFANVMSTKVKVTISSCSTIIGLLLFALMPTAKVLVVTVMLLGLALGMNDFTYLFALAFLANKAGINISVRRLAEKTFALGICIGLFFNALALSLNRITIIFIVGLILLMIIAFMYPVSSVAGMVDSVQKKTVPVNKKKKKTNNKKMTSSRDAAINGMDNSVSGMDANMNYNQDPQNVVYNQQAYMQTPYPENYEPVAEQYQESVPYSNEAAMPQEPQYDGYTSQDTGYSQSNETSFIDDNPYGGNV